MKVNEKQGLYKFDIKELEIKISKLSQSAKTKKGQKKIWLKVKIIYNGFSAK